MTETAPIAPFATLRIADRKATGAPLTDGIDQAKHTARVLIGEARARRQAGHGFWCMFRMAQSARRRAALPQPAAIADQPSTRPAQLELFS